MSRIRAVQLAAVWVLLASLGGQGIAAPADVVYRNGRIYTVNPSQPWAESLAIRDGRFVAVGSNSDVASDVGDATRVVDLQGRFVMPGLHDAHQHLLLTGMQWNFDCRLPDGGDIEAIVAALKGCEKGKAADEWLVANVYRPDRFPDGIAHRRHLDAAFPDRPVYIREWSWHHALANSAALRRAGVDRDTSDPTGGRLIRDAQGELTGELIEKATWLVMRAIPPPPPEVIAKALEWSAQMCSRHGITSAQEASATEALLKGVQTLDEQGKWPLSLAAHIVWNNPEFGEASPSDLDALIARREQYRSPHLHTDFVKIVVDGSPLQPHMTDAQLGPHGDVPRHKLLESPEEVEVALKRFDREGIKAKMHVTGTASARVALDAIEAVRKASPSSSLRHEVAHSVRFDAADLPRVARLGAVAELSPAIWQVKGALTETLAGAFQFKSLIDSGALITTGTDWVILTAPNLFPALGGMVDHGAESIRLEQAIEAMTINGARSVGWEQSVGSIEVGKNANFIVLDRNLFGVPVREIAGTTVLSTVFEGNVVYTSDN
jgi:predicted amidohydrolase YtcJ